MPRQSGPKYGKGSRPRPYGCRYCSHMCTRPTELKVHTRTHTREAPFRCITCDKAFTTNSNLTRHTKGPKHQYQLEVMPWPTPSPTLSNSEEPHLSPTPSDPSIGAAESVASATSASGSASPLLYDETQTPQTSNGGIPLTIELYSGRSDQARTATEYSLLSDHAYLAGYQQSTTISPFQVSAHERHEVMLDRALSTSLPGFRQAVEINSDEYAGPSNGHSVPFTAESLSNIIEPFTPSLTPIRPIPILHPHLQWHKATFVTGIEPEPADYSNHSSFPFPAESAPHHPATPDLHYHAPYYSHCGNVYQSTHKHTASSLIDRMPSRGAHVASYYLDVPYMDEAHTTAAQVHMHSGFVHSTAVPAQPHDARVGFGYDEVLLYASNTTHGTTNMYEGK